MDRSAHGLVAHRARSRVQRAVGGGGLLPAVAVPCVRCQAPASEYHHFRGYGRDEALDVQAMCRDCHVDAHRVEQLLTLTVAQILELSLRCTKDALDLARRAAHYRRIAEQMRLRGLSDDDTLASVPAA